LSEAGVRRLAFTRDVVIIGGCGHAGLPLAIAFADRGLRVGIYDVNARQIDDLTRLAEREVVMAAASWYMAGTV
jgi:UDP-N-acetyl-D-mannosaminuronate dehydrogenase